MRFIQEYKTYIMSDKNINNNFDMSKPEILKY